MPATRLTRRAILAALCAAVSTGTVLAQPPAAQQAAPTPVAILGIPAEIKDVEARLERTTVERVQGATFTVGYIGDTRVVLGRTGAGKANAAMAATLIVTLFKPSAVFFTGTAGAMDPELRPGDVVIGSTVGYHDFGLSTEKGLRRGQTRNVLTGELNPMLFPADAKLLAAARVVAATFMPGRAPVSTRVPVVREGVIVTGDVFVANPAQRDEIRRTLNAAAVEMEGAAVAHVCWQLGVPALIVRSITDSADGGTPDAYRQNIEVASRNAATLTMAVIAQLGRR